MDDNTKIKDFTDLIAWQKAHQLVLTIYRITKKFPDAEKFVLTHQMTRAAISITSNIAEGFGRYINKEFIRFLEYSAASSMEIRSMLYILFDRKYIDEIEFEKCYQLTNDLTNTTLGLIRYLKTKI